MPKTVVYKPNSVVFFHGDTDERIYILKSGRIVLRSQDIETGTEIQDLIQKGEFFGVRSSLGRYPREEDALVLSNAEVVQFSVGEFEQFVSSNTRIIVKMLKVFSNQLRRIHSKVSSMLNQDDTIDPEDGLHQSATFYFAQRQLAHAKYIWTRYLELYPQGRHAEDAKQQLKRISQGASAMTASGTAAAASPATGGDGSGSKGLSEIGRTYFEAESMFANDRFDEALVLFRRVVESADEEYSLKSRVEVGKCLFAQEKYGDTIRHFSSLIQENPRMPQLAEVLYVIGCSYGKTGDAAKASTILKKARGAVQDEPALVRRIEKAQREFGN